MKRKTKLPPPPKQLRTDTAAWWNAIVGEYDLPPEDLAVLETACVFWDQFSRACETIAASETGEYIKDRFDQLKEHPAVAVQQNSTRLFLAALRQLGLGLAPVDNRLPDPTPPRLHED